MYYDEDIILDIRLNLLDKYVSQNLSFVRQILIIMEQKKN